MLNWFLIIGYILIVILIGYISSRKKTEEGFMISKRNLGTIALAGTIAASLIGGNALITYSAFIFKWGIAILWGLVGFAFGMWILGKIGNKLKKQGKRYYTLPDFFYDRYGKNTGLIVAAIVIFWFSIILLIQYIAGGKIISSLVGLPYWFSVLIMGAVVFIYSFLGGFKAVVKTDIFQYLLFIVLAAFVGFSMIKGKAIEPSQFNIMNFGIGKTIAFILIGAATIFTGPDMWQRVYAARNKKSIIRGLILATIAVLIGFSVIGMIGMAARSAFPQIVPEEAFIYGIKSLLPVQFLGLVFILLFAVIMSTLDTVLFVLATNFSEDIMVKNINPKIDKVKYTKIGMFLFAFLLMIIAIFVQDIISIALAFASLGLVFAPTIIGAFFYKKELKPKAIHLSLIIGLIAVLIVLFSGFISPETSVVSLPVAIVFLLIGQVIFKRKSIKVI
jgi:SSS family solute:Na+ symporter